MTMQPEVTAALAFVRAQGLVLASAKGNVPRLIEAIVGEPITGNWWAHPRGSFIYNVLAQVCESDDVLVCRLLRGKITLVHRRLWPALVRLAHRLRPEQLAQVVEQHTASGRHVSRDIAFPLWVPASVQECAARLSEAEAVGMLGSHVVATMEKPLSPAPKHTGRGLVPRRKRLTSRL